MSGSSDIARPGIREFVELAAQFYCFFMKKLGAEDNFLLMSASRSTISPSPLPASACSTSATSFFPRSRPAIAANSCRSVAPPSSANAQVIGEKFAEGDDAMAAGLAAGRAAQRSPTSRAPSRCYPKAGYGDYCRPPYMRVRGHGLGITLGRPGDIVDTNTRMLEAHDLRHASQPVTPRKRLSDVRRAGGGHRSGARALSVRPAALDVIAV